MGYISISYQTLKNLLELRDEDFWAFETLIILLNHYYYDDTTQMLDFEKISEETGIEIDEIYYRIHHLKKIHVIRDFRPNSYEIVNQLYFANEISDREYYRQSTLCNIGGKRVWLNRELFSNQMMEFWNHPNSRLFLQLLIESAGENFNRSECADELLEEVLEMLEELKNLKLIDYEVHCPYVIVFYNKAYCMYKGGQPKPDTLLRM